ncbi:MAG: hexitol phosphatase HxpB [Bacteroidota bacterium]|jgi:HAD superfamily hydrolase (TIGR01509 family)
MLQKINAVIFDMDGLIANTEPLWRRAMVEGFTECGINFTEEDCRITTGMRFLEVVEFWSQARPFNIYSVKEAHDMIINKLCVLIEKNDVELPGVAATIEACKANDLKIGLATSSGKKIIDTVLKKLGLFNKFDSIVSAENLLYGKPNPQVFIDCAHSLKVFPNNCLVLEDSVNGVIAAKAAFMKVVAVPDKHSFEDLRFSIADYKLSDLTLFHELLEKIKIEVSATA